MPRKQDEPRPLMHEGKLSEETRRQVFRNEEESETAERKPGEERHYSGASESGSAKVMRHDEASRRR